MRSATAGFLMPAGGQLASRTRYKRCNAAEGDVARRLGIVVGREDGGKLPCKGSAPVFHSHRKCWDIASRSKTALLAGSGASAALAIGERFDLPGFIMDFTSLMCSFKFEVRQIMMLVSNDLQRKRHFCFDANHYPTGRRGLRRNRNVWKAASSELSHFKLESTMPNKSLEPTAVGPFSSAFAVHVASRRWLSFLR
jgi:hypothetical protein